MIKNRVLVTGGSGFIGSHLVHRLLADGARVAVTVRSGNVMKNERLRDCWDDIEVVEADLRNRGALACIPRLCPRSRFSFGRIQSRRPKLHSGRGVLRRERQGDCKPPRYM